MIIYQIQSIKIFFPWKKERIRKSTPLKLNDFKQKEEEGSNVNSPLIQIFYNCEHPFETKEEVLWKIASNNYPLRFAFEFPFSFSNEYSLKKLRCYSSSLSSFDFWLSGTTLISHTIPFNHFSAEQATTSTFTKRYFLLFSLERN